MSNLIEELKSTHVEISEIFRQIVEAGITSEQGRKKMFQAQEALLAHIKQENEKLYPDLWKEAETDPRLKLKLESFAKDLDAVAQTVISFFEKYTVDTPEAELNQAFKKMYVALTNRLVDEETKLFPEHKKRD